MAARAALVDSTKSSKVSQSDPYSAWSATFSRSCAARRSADSSAAAAQRSAFWRNSSSTSLARRTRSACFSRKPLAAAVAAALACEACSATSNWCLAAPKASSFRFRARFSSLRRSSSLAA